MEKAILTFLFMFLIFGMIFGSATIMAKEGKGIIKTANVISAKDIETSSDDSGAANNNNDERNVSELRDRIKQAYSLNNVSKIFNKTVTLENGGTVNLYRSIVREDGTFEIMIIKSLTSANGTLIRQISIEIKRDLNGTTESISIDGMSINITKDMEINDLFDNDDTDIEAVSDGNATKIKIFPDEASQIAREKSNSSLNITNVSLEEIRHNNIPRVVYNIESNEEGRFLGVFKLAVKAQTQIDPETGEVVDVIRPWWAFLVSVPKETNSGGSNGTNSS